jgi:uncharacterized protein
MSNPYAAVADRPAIELSISARAAFIARTYFHLFGAIVAFTLIEIALFTLTLSSGVTVAEEIAWKLGGNWMLVLGGFILVSWLATRTAHTARSLPVQYAALIGFILAEALVFCPLLWHAFTFAEGAISSAAIVTLGGFAGLTFVVFWTRKDFSFLRSFLMWLMPGALILIVVSLFTGFSLGLWFSAGMVALAGAAILYDTSNILHHYPEDRYVAASLELFASVAMMFWYVLRIFISRD